MPKTESDRSDCHRARIMLGVLAFMIVVCLAVALSSMAQGFAEISRPGPNDVDLYQAEVDRVAAGENYYHAAAAELRRFGYPTQSVFNWRTPLPMALLGVLPHPLVGKVLLVALAVMAILLAFEWTAREAGRGASALCVLLMIGATLPCFLNNFYVMPVLWAGVLIAISLCAFGIDRPKLGVATGIAAVFVRDLAGPYCVFGLAWALGHRRWKEATMWLAGLAAYAIFFGAHVGAVDALRTPAGLAQPHSWVQFGGAAFLISAVQMNGFLLVLPQWVSAIYFPLALLGFATWSSSAGQRAGLTAILYVMLFALIGQPINQYWGAMIAPLLCLGAARAPWALRDLYRSAIAVRRPAFRRKGLSKITA